MQLKYEGIKFNEFKKDLENINIPEVSIHCIENFDYSSLPGNYIFIHNFHCVPERKGYGTEAMSIITKLAEKHKIILFLFPSGSSKYFYSKFNFEEKSEIYKDVFQPLKVFRFYDGYDDILRKFLKNEQKIFTKLRKWIKNQSV